MVITIDGPTASGKSTVARLLAKKLGFYYLNTGYLYRAVAYLLINNCSYTDDNLKNPDPVDLEQYVDPNRLIYDYDENYKEKILFDGMDITPFLKTSFIDKSASIVSANKLVRELLLEVQRVAGKKFDLVAEGRDIGSVVFPDADVKIYLTASVNTRAERWRAEQLEKGNTFSFEEAVNIVKDRDKRDREREISPLIIPDDAIVIDDTDLDIQQTLEKVLECIREAKK